jgi:archaellum component FlaF (FlaF/FlaG flagellin family)
MKTGVVLLGFACISLLVFSGVIGYSYYDNDKQLQNAKAVIKSQDEDIAKLNADYTRVVADNVKYMKESRLKSFTTLKELERFLKVDATDQEYKGRYASEACLQLMKNGREQGYWIGMGALNQTPEGLLSAMVYDRKYGGMSWTTYALAVVGDDQLYFIDPQDDKYIFPIMTMSADFQDYSGKEVNFK